MLQEMQAHHPLAPNRIYHLPVAPESKTSHHRHDFVSICGRWTSLRRQSGHASVPSSFTDERDIRPSSTFKSADGTSSPSSSPSASPRPSPPSSSSSEPARNPLRQTRRSWRGFLLRASSACHSLSTFVLASCASSHHCWRTLTAWNRCSTLGRSSSFSSLSFRRLGGTRRRSMPACGRRSSSSSPCSF